MNLTAEQISTNFDKLIKISDQYFSGIRLEKTTKMYGDLGDTLALMPASSFEHFHSCYPGGHVVHTLNVIKFSIYVYKLWKMCGADLSNFTIEELVFSAMFHDLGKAGNIKFEKYIPNDSSWHVKNQGRFYKLNPELQMMPDNQRSMYLLQKFNIEVSENEFISIMAHEALYNDDSKAYFTQFSDDKTLKFNLPYILHQADVMAYRIEYEQWRNSDKANKYSPLKIVKSKENKKVTDKKFDDLFTNK